MELLFSSLLFSSLLFSSLRFSFLLFSSLLFSTLTKLNRYWSYLLIMQVQPKQKTKCLCTCFQYESTGLRVLSLPQINFFFALSVSLYSSLPFQPLSLILSYLLSGDKISACRLKQSSADKYQTQSDRERGRARVCSVRTWKRESLFCLGSATEPDDLDDEMMILTILL